MDLIRIYNIISFLEDFNFPLAEAMRKEIWWAALEKKSNGFLVKIYVLSNKKNKIEYEKNGIKVIILNKNKLWKIRGDICHFFVGIVEIRLLLSFMCKCNKRKITFLGGNILGNSKFFLRKIILRFLPFLFSEIEVLSNYQAKQLGKYKLKYNIVKPYLPSINIIKKERNKKFDEPLILYMGHLTLIKGVDLLLESFQMLIECEDFFLKDKIKLIIANNNVRSPEKEIINKLNFLINKYKNKIILKEIIDPFIELSKSSVYVYPLKSIEGTMAFPLSLYESIMIGTPIVSTCVGSIPEFFDERFLVEPDAKAIFKKIKEVFENYDKYRNITKEQKENFQRLFKNF